MRKDTKLHIEAFHAGYQAGYENGKRDAVKHGRWSRGIENSGSVYAHCSACNRKMNDYCYGYPHCPMCGAKMDGKENEDGEEVH